MLLASAYSRIRFFGANVTGYSKCDLLDIWVLFVQKTQNVFGILVAFREVKVVLSRAEWTILPLDFPEYPKVLVQGLASELRNFRCCCIFDVIPVDLYL